MLVSLATIVSYLRSENIVFDVLGEDIKVQKIMAFSSSMENALSYFIGTKPPSNLANIKNSIIICELEKAVVFPPSNSVIYTKHPQLCFYIASSLFEEKKRAFIHPQAVVNSSSKIGTNVSIGPFSVLEECEIGDNVTIGASVNIKKGTIVEGNVVIQSNTVLGVTGVIWTWNANQKVMCVQTGNTIIREGVFLGSNISIVKGAFENKPTVIGSKSMISHGTMIGHGVNIGDKCHIANNVSLAGSVIIGNNSFLGSGVVIRPHVTIPPDTIVGAGAVVVKNYLTEGIVLVGNPAREMQRNESILSGVPAPYSR